MHGLSNIFVLKALWSKKSYDSVIDADCSPNHYLHLIKLINFWLKRKFKLTMSTCLKTWHIRMGQCSGFFFSHLLEVNYTLSLEKEMATHSSVLAWRIAGTGEPGGLPSVGLHRVRHDRSDSAAAAYLESQLDSWVGKIPWRKDSPPTPVFWASLVAQMVKNPPALWESWVGSLSGMATHSSILAGRIPMDRGAWQATVHGIVKNQTWVSD